jgi:hypothetical protein
MGCFHHSAQCGSHPSKNSPRQQPYRVTAAVALLPFGSHSNRSCAETLEPTGNTRRQAATAFSSTLVETGPKPHLNTECRLKTVPSMR